MSTTDSHTRQKTLVYYMSFFSSTRKHKIPYHLLTFYTHFTHQKYGGFYS